MHLPELPVELFLRAVSTPKPLAVTEKGRIHACYRSGSPDTLVLDVTASLTLLESSELKLLAKADTLAPIAGHRWQAYWHGSTGAVNDDILGNAPIREAPAMLPFPTAAQNTVADYDSVGLTLRRHPVDLLRKILDHKRISTAEDIRRLPSGHSVSAAGLVTGRQRPGTASGVVFVTLEDETG